MKNFKNKKYLLLDLDGVCYGKHNNYSLERVFGQVSKRMTMFISEKLKIDMSKAKELQTNYFYKYNTSLNGLMIHHDIVPEEFLKYIQMKVLHNFYFLSLTHNQRQLINQRTVNTRVKPLFKLLKLKSNLWINF